MALEDILAQLQGAQDTQQDSDVELLLQLRKLMEASQVGGMLPKSTAAGQGYVGEQGPGMQSPAEASISGLMSNLQNQYGYNKPAVTEPTGMDEAAKVMQVINMSKALGGGAGSGRGGVISPQVLAASSGGMSSVQAKELSEMRKNGLKLLGERRMEEKNTNDQIIEYEKLARQYETQSPPTPNSKKLAKEYRSKVDTLKTSQTTSLKVYDDQLAKARQELQDKEAEFTQPTSTGGTITPTKDAKGKTVYSNYKTRNEIQPQSIKSTSDSLQKLGELLIAEGKKQGGLPKNAELIPKTGSLSEKAKERKATSEGINFGDNTNLENKVTASGLNQGPPDPSMSIDPKILEQAALEDQLRARTGDMYSNPVAQAQQEMGQNGPDSTFSGYIASMIKNAVGLGHDIGSRNTKPSSEVLGNQGLPTAQPSYINPLADLAKEKAQGGPDSSFSGYVASMVKNMIPPNSEAAKPTPEEVDKQIKSYGYDLNSRQFDKYVMAQKIRLSNIMQRNPSNEDLAKFLVDSKRPSTIGPSRAAFPSYNNPGAEGEKAKEYATMQDLLDKLDRMRSI